MWPSTCPAAGQCPTLDVLAALDLFLALRNYLRCRMPEKPSANYKLLPRKEARELDVKISFLEGLVRRDPQCVEALQMLGDYYSQRGNHNHSLRVDQELARLQPHNPMVF